MKLEKRQIMLISFMLFSLFFGAGNLIFPPFLGQSAGNTTMIAMCGFIITAVILPVLGIIVVAKFEGLDKLGAKVGKRFAVIITLLIYLSIGPGLGIPRAASVPFEMAIAPYLPESYNLNVAMLIYSLLFFTTALWLCLNPKKLVDRIGKVLTPTLLTLLVLLFINFLFRGEVNIANPVEAYASNAFLKGFTEGYNTMDAIAALNFGLVIATTLKSFGLKEKKDRMHYTYLACLFAGTILALVYMMLSYMGMCSSGVYALLDNGAWTLRCIVQEVFGEFGAFILALIFTLACLTTCVGLINSISQFFEIQFKKLSYNTWAILITVFSFLICNLGLNMILSISVPVLNAIYPESIVLIILGLTDKLWKDNKYVYPLVVGGVTVVAVIHALEGININIPLLTNLTKLLPLYKLDFAWLSVALVLLVLSILINKFKKC